MILKSISDAISLLRRPILWLPGLYAGLLAAGFLWLSFNGGEFIAGKILFLGAVIFPFFLAGALGCLKTGDYNLTTFGRTAMRYYFPIVLPIIVVMAIIILLLILFSIPFTITGLGADPSLIGGLFIGVTIPILLFAFYIDNIAVIEDLTVFATLKRSMIITSRSFLTVLTCVVTSIVAAGVTGIVLATVWGMILSDRFAPYINLGYAEQQKVFSGFGLADWQKILGVDGIMITAVVIGLYMMIIIAFLILLKHQTYLMLKTVPETIVTVQGEYDEKGRWYKY